MSKTRLVSKALAAGMIALIAMATFSAGHAFAQNLLDATSHPKFVNPLPVPARIDASQGKNNNYTMDMREVTQWLGLYAPDNTPLMTTVWGYGLKNETATYPGPTFVAHRDVPVDITWRNMLPTYNFPDGPGAHLLPVDPNLHIAHPIDGGIPTVAHLHGGHTESASDGLPEAWFTQGFRETGPHFVKRRYHYDNDQESATLWYHDHALGITRLNVYAGLAGFYLLRDRNEKTLMKNGVLPCAQYEIEVVIQDRMFTDDGELFYPSTDPEIEPGFDPLPPGPSAIAEFFGDFILVNGVAWPKLDVEPRKYRFRMLNGSDSRFYVLEFHDAQLGGVAQPFLQIGTDVGLLEKPVPLTKLLMGPGERCDLIVDFGGMDPGDQIFLRNFGPDDPLKGFNPDGTLSDGEGGVLPPADPSTTGQIMAFNVVAPMDVGAGNPSGRDWDVNWMWCDQDPTIDATTDLRPTIDPLTQTGATRQLVLFEGLDSYGRLQPLLGTLDQGSLAWFEPITENPMVDDVEVWEVYNATEDAHPIHLHLVGFQIINRESFDGDVEEKPQPQHDGSYGVGGVLTVNSLGGDAVGPAANEAGWKDTAIMLPGQVTRVIAKFDREGRYVWHCHILSHEDHEMMRPYYIGPMMAEMAAFGQESSSQSLALGASLGPTPEIRFELPAAGDVEVKIFNARGAVVRTLLKETRSAGGHVLRWDGTDDRGNNVPSGVYFTQVLSGNLSQSKKVVLVK